MNVRLTRLAYLYPTMGRGRWSGGGKRSTAGARNAAKQNSVLLSAIPLQKQLNFQVLQVKSYGRDYV